ncbi:MAG: hypothetical protein Q9168_008066, partial [Polycauliona sp. 1 TL-2023]
MPSVSFFGALPLLFLAIPSLALSAPAPQARQNGIDPKTGQRYPFKIQAAEVHEAKAVKGNDMSLSITVSGTQPGDKPITCTRKWFFDTTTLEEGAVTQEFTCTDPALHLRLSQFADAANFAFLLYLTYPNLPHDTWNTGTADDSIWKCDPDKTFCSLRSAFTLGEKRQYHEPSTPQDNRDTTGRGTIRGRGSSAGVKPLGTYNISTAEVLSINRLDTATKAVIGNDNSLNITVTGTHPGALPINCSATWYFVLGKGTNAPLFTCTDPAMFVQLTQEAQVGVNIKAVVFIQYNYPTGPRAQYEFNTATDFLPTAGGRPGSVTLKTSHIAEDIVENPAPADSSSASNADAAGSNDSSDSDSATGSSTNDAEDPDSSPDADPLVIEFGDFHE